MARSFEESDVDLVKMNVAVSRLVAEYDNQVTHGEFRNT